MNDRIPVRRRRELLQADPGPVGGATGHLEKVRQGGLFLFAGVILRFFGFFALVVEPILGGGMLLASSLGFLLAGWTALSSPGRAGSRAVRPATVAMLFLALAEIVAILTTLDQTWAGGLWRADRDAQLSVFTAMVAHPLLMVGAAVGLWLHLRGLLRPRAPLRRAVQVVLGLVVSLLLCWGLGSTILFWGLIIHGGDPPWGHDWLGGLALMLLLPALLLPPMATAVAVMMMLQRPLPLETLMRGLRQGLARTEAVIELEQPLPDGARLQGSRRGRIFALRLDLARLPVAIELELPLSSQIGALELRRRGKAGGVGTGDLLLDRMVSVEGPSAERAGALLADLHEPLLAVIQGRPGSEVADGVLRVRAMLPQPGLRRLPEPELRMAALVEQVVQEGAALAEALEARAQQIRG